MFTALVVIVVLAGILAASLAPLAFAYHIGRARGAQAEKARWRALYRSNPTACEWELLTGEPMAGQFVIFGGSRASKSERPLTFDGDRGFGGHRP